MKLKVLVPAAAVGGSATRFHCNLGTREGTVKQNVSQRELRMARSD